MQKYTMKSIPGSAQLFVVATPIGNLSEFSPRAMETLSSCEIIACEDTRQTMKLMSRFDIHSRLVSYHKFNESYRTEELISRMQGEGIRVAVVSDAGTPCISDPGYKIVEAARAAGIPVYAVSGSSAVVAALSVCGFPVSGFTFFGFLPRKKKEVQAIFNEIHQSARDVFVFYESPKRIRGLAAAIQQELPHAQVCFCADITKLHEKYFHGQIDDVVAEIEASPVAEKGEYTVVVYTGTVRGGVEGTDEMEAEENGECADLSRKAKELMSGKNLSPEALLVDVMVRHSLNKKDAMARILSEHDEISKNQLYQASLRLKELL